MSSNVPTYRPSIGSVIRTVLREFDTLDEETIRSEVFARINPTDYGHYLQVLLRAEVARTVSETRRQASSQFAYTEPEVGASQPAPQTFLHADDDAPPLVPVVNTWKRDQRYQDFLSQRIIVAIGEPMKYVGDLTAEDWFRAAEINFDQATANRIEGERKIRIGKILQREKVKKTSDLTAEAMQEALKG